MTFIYIDLILFIIEIYYFEIKSLFYFLKVIEVIESIKDRTFMHIAKKDHLLLLMPHLFLIVKRLQVAFQTIILIIKIFLEKRIQIFL